MKLPRFLVFKQADARHRDPDNIRRKRKELVKERKEAEVEKEAQELLSDLTGG